MNVLTRYKVNGVAIFSDALRTALGLSLLFRTLFCLFEHVTPILLFGEYTELKILFIYVYNYR